MGISEALDNWSRLLGPAQVITGDELDARYGQDTGGARRAVPAALKIADRVTLPDVMRIARRCNVAVYPISTGKNWGYGSSLPVRDGCVILDLSGMNKIIHFDTDFGVVTLEPGVTQGMLSEFLDTHCHPFLVPVTGAGPGCSLLGNALERGYGVTPFTDHFGAVTDLEAVLADGSIYKSTMREVAGDELARLFKWGLGPYVDGIFTQAGFGIVTQMSIALARRPLATKACLFSLRDDSLLETAILRIRDVMGSLSGIMGAINLMNQHRVLSMTAPFPSDRLGTDGMIPPHVISDMARRQQIFPWTGFGTLYGAPRVVAATQKEIRKILRGVATRLLFLSPDRARQLAGLARFVPGHLGSGLQSMTATLAKSLELVNGRPNETALPLAYWRNQRPQSAGPRNPALDGCGLLWYAPLVPMRPGDVRQYVDMVKSITPRHGVEPLITLTTLSDKLFDSTVPIVFDRDKPAAIAAARACFDELLDAGHARGWFPYRVGIDALQKLASLQPASDGSRLADRLRTALDPEHLLSPGRYC